jgi:ABC-2 type transport system permease protein
LAAFALVLVFTYSFTWPAAAIGLSVRSPQVAQSIGTLWLLPAVFLSNIFVEPRTLSGWLQPLAYWNPVSAATTAARELLGTSSDGALPGSGRAVLVTLLWSAVLLAVFVPVAVWRYRKPPAG